MSMTLAISLALAGVAGLTVVVTWLCRSHLRLRADFEAHRRTVGSAIHAEAAHAVRAQTRGLIRSEASQAVDRLTRRVIHDEVATALLSERFSRGLRDTWPGLTRPSMGSDPGLS